MNKDERLQMTFPIIPLLDNVVIGFFQLTLETILSKLSVNVRICDPICPFREDTHSELV